MPIPEKNKKLTIDEFLKISENSTERMELMDGEIVAMASPSRIHQRISSRMYGIIDAYVRNGLCEVLQAVDAKLQEDIVIPDLMVVCDPSKLDDNRCNGVPDWIVEILSTNRDDDLVRKYRIYKYAGVREYWIVDPKNQKTLVYFFEKNDFPNIYTFDTPIPVEIYNKKLKITISELL
ncbi:MAG: Uma2 family endonuclease [Oscillospiraceae bacterium]|nr:Uma2 family endonuclease [Oscillospiraceae bacterium]